DPLAEIAEDVGCTAVANRTRFDDREAVLTILPALDQVDTYPELAALRVTIRGEDRIIGAIAKNSQAVFDAERCQFLKAQQAQCADYIDRYGRSGTVALGGELFAREATQLARGLKEDMAAAGCDVPFSTIASRTVLGAGYSVARSCSYV